MFDTNHDAIRCASRLAPDGRDGSAGVDPLAATGHVAEAQAGLDRRAFTLRTGLVAGAALFGGPLFAGLVAPRPVQAARGATLQGQVVQEVKRLRATGMIRADEHTSWSVYDFTGRKKLVSINEDAPRQAASMFKPFVALAFFYTVQQRGSQARYTPEIRATMERMIRNSGNDETNRIMELVSLYNGGGGPRTVEAVLRRNAPRIFQQTRLVEYIPAGGRTYLNQASARDYSRFLYALWHRQLPYAEELKTLMGMPNRNRITQGVAGMSNNVRVYHKTGSTARLCGDMGIIEAYDRRGRPRPYTFVGIIEKPAGTDYYRTWITNRSNAIRSVSGVAYAYMREQHGIA